MAPQADSQSHSPIPSCSYVAYKYAPGAGPAIAAISRLWTGHLHHSTHLTRATTGSTSITNASTLHLYGHFHKGVIVSISFTNTKKLWYNLKFISRSFMNRFQWGSKYRHQRDVILLYMTSYCQRVIIWGTQLIEAGWQWILMYFYTWVPQSETDWQSWGG